MADGMRMEDVTTLHDLGHTMQAAKAMVVSVENAHPYDFYDTEPFVDIIKEALHEIKTGQQDTVYVVIKITKE